jgi:hypothetical protein
MPRSLFIGFLLLGWLCRPGSAAANHFTIELKVQAGKASATAHAETAALGVQPKKREVLRVKSGDRITVKWRLTNANSKSEFKNVLVHFFTAKEEKLGQKAPPKLNKSVAAESALSMDFKPGDLSRGEMVFTISTPGYYLLRLETIGAAVGEDGHEHFAALDLAVE